MGLVRHFKKFRRMLTGVEWRMGIAQPRTLKDAPTLNSLNLNEPESVGGSFRARSQPLEPQDILKPDEGC